MTWELLPRVETAERVSGSSRRGRPPYPIISGASGYRRSDFDHSDDGREGCRARPAVRPVGG